jgi:hypothetical protein
MVAEEPELIRASSAAGLLLIHSSTLSALTLMPLLVHSAGPVAAQMVASLVIV